MRGTSQSPPCRWFLGSRVLYCAVLYCLVISSHSCSVFLCLAFLLAAEKRPSQWSHAPMLMLFRRWVMQCQPSCLLPVSFTYAV